MKLPEFAAGQIDIVGCRILWLPSRRRAEQIEQAMHKILAPYAADPGHRLDGATEWFEHGALHLALQALTTMPTSDPTGRPARLVALTEPPPNTLDTLEAHGPMEAWWRLEDLWTRLSMLCTLDVVFRDACYLVVLRGFRNVFHGPVGELRGVVMDITTYRWQVGDEFGSFVQLMDFDGDDLVLTLATMPAMQRWPDGVSLTWQVRGCLLKLQRQIDAVKTAAAKSEQAAAAFANEFGKAKRARNIIFERSRRRCVCVRASHLDDLAVSA
ncbi:hypothetical protein [Piscinibacter sakaiensis]|uniref:hypothetical protein n=1 Tax=Piscinibacter sakaiensis TaxID=1547922 RepID=UPI003AAFD6F6